MNTQIDLRDVPETMLWPLWNRAAEQRRGDRLIDDPHSAQLVEQIDYAFEENFGKPNAGHAIRARLIDDSIKAWLQEHRSGSVVALGEGLESQFWRVDDGAVNWYSIDLPEAIEVRSKFLPQNDRVRFIPCSALDHSWMDSVPQSEPVFFTMAGLLMYFEEQQNERLLTQIAERFPGSDLFFDVIPTWMSRKTMKGFKVTKSYTMPPCPWGLNLKNRTWLTDLHASLRIKRAMSYADDFPKRMRPWSWLSRISWMRDNIAPWMVHLHVAEGK